LPQVSGALPFMRISAEKVLFTAFAFFAAHERSSRGRFSRKLAMSRERDKGCFAPKGPEHASTGQRPVWEHIIFWWKPQRGGTGQSHKWPCTEPRVAQTILVARPGASSFHDRGPGLPVSGAVTRCNRFLTRGLRHRAPRFVTPLRGSGLIGLVDTGRCPVLTCSAPSGQDTGRCRRCPVLICCVPSAPPSRFGSNSILGRSLMTIASW
jgi:hypothetical protein